MKFEKFLKSVGTHGHIYKRDNGDRWLICDGVGMMIPLGVDNLLGSGAVSHEIQSTVEGLHSSSIEGLAELVSAFIPADGKARDIIRIFGDRFGDKIGICNAHYGLLDKSDNKLYIVEITNDDLDDEKYLLIYNENDELIGFIKETN